MSPPSHQRRVRRRTTAPRAQKLPEEERAALYFDLLQDPAAHLLGVTLRTQAESALCLIDQTERRILLGQKVPATAQRLSMFETHTDVLRKRDQGVCGHKVCLSFGKSGVVLGAQVLRHDPADSTLAEPAVEQIEQNTGRHSRAPGGPRAQCDVTTPWA